MKCDVLRCEVVREGKDQMLEIFLDCGHKVRCYDPGLEHLRPSQMDCYKCNRMMPVDVGAKR